VLLGRLRHAAKTLDRRDRPAIDFLVGYTVAQRLPGDEVFAALMKKSLRKFDKRSSKVIASIQSAKGDQKLADLACESLASQLNRLDRALASDSHELADLHEVRIIGKRLRYTMEVVADCYPETFREEVYPLIGEMQELLGDLHDHAVSVQLYAELCERLPQLLRKRSKRYRPALEGLIERHQQAIDAGLPHFDEWKERWRSLAEEMAKMVENLEESPVRPLPVDVKSDDPATDTASISDDGMAGE
jgi:CHAD domain-containing protein